VRFYTETSFGRDTALGFFLEECSRIVIPDDPHLPPAHFEYRERTLRDRDTIGIMLLDAGADPSKVVSPNHLQANAELAGTPHTAHRLKEMGF